MQAPSAHRPKPVPAKGIQRFVSRPSSVPPSSGGPARGTFRQHAQLLERFIELVQLLDLAGHRKVIATHNRQDLLPLVVET
jgi:hypothetical protein